MAEETKAVAKKTKKAGTTIAIVVLAVGTGWGAFATAKWIMLKKNVAAFYKTNKDAVDSWNKAFPKNQLPTS